MAKKAALSTAQMDTNIDAETGVAARIAGTGRS
jgi:hypothetical protein